MILVSYPMYFDPLRTMVNSKNRKSLNELVFLAKILENGVFSRNLANLAIFGPKYTFNETFSIFPVYHCSERNKIHRIRYQNHEFSIIYFLPLFNFMHFLSFWRELGTQMIAKILLFSYYVMYSRYKTACARPKID